FDCIIFFQAEDGIRDLIVTGVQTCALPISVPGGPGMTAAHDDLLFQAEIKEAVRNAYAAIPSGGGDPVARRLYSEEELEGIPHGAVEWALGVGNPVRYAGLQPGETVLDVGSGGGIDTIMAARRV